MAKEYISVLIVDDNSMLRVGLGDTIVDEEDMRLIGEASNGVEALEKYRELQPDVVTMDYRMPIQDGVEATRRIVDEFPDAQIIFLSMYDGEQDVRDAWHAGARGYVSKTDASDKLLKTIRKVARGERCFPDAFIRELEAEQEPAVPMP